jgi:hypothetical protein
MKLGISSEDLQDFPLTRLDLMKNKVQVGQIQNWV